MLDEILPINIEIGINNLFLSINLSNVSKISLNVKTSGPTASIFLE